MDLLQEAIADVNRVKELAYENAKQAIVETFQPRIQRMISSKLAEEEFDDMGLDGFGEEEPAVDAFPPEEEKVYEGQKYIESGDDGTPSANPGKAKNESELEEDFDALIKELEDELAGEEPAFVDDAPMPEDDTTIEALTRKLKEVECEQMPKPKEPKADGHVSEVARLRGVVTRLTQEKKDALRAVSTMKNAMNEVNLLNAKLMFSSKVMQKFDLTESQQVKILETFDRAKNLREVKLIYEAIQNNYRDKSGKRVVPQKPRPVTESASRPIRTTKKGPLTENYDFANRWKVLAGLRPINN